MDFDIRRLKGTPVKLVYYGDEVAGCFYYGTFIRRDSFTEEIRRVVDKYHADTLVERIERWNSV